jgi:transcriptional regulator with XRE-family HTH domain
MKYRPRRLAHTPLQTGQQIREGRALLGLDQTQFGRLIGRAGGFTRRSVSRRETTDEAPGAPTNGMIQDAFKRLGVEVFDKPNPGARFVGL